MYSNEGLFGLLYFNIQMNDQQGIIDDRYNSAVNALSYGFNCLVYDKRGDKLFDCILSIHDEYINILHLIIARKVSYIMKLHQIYSITDNQFSIETKLSEYKINHYIILYTHSLESIVFAFKTQYEKRQLKIGLEVFVKEAKLYYDRLSQFDPFKSQAMMIFLHADKDGGNLLDIEQIQNILDEMKLHKQKEQILNDILEINKYLYEREKLRRPQGMSDSELNQLGFQYLLRYYSIKEDIAKYFSDFCPMFKLKAKGQKNSIVDIVRSNEKPIMSASQLKQFYEVMLCQKITEQSCLDMIKSFPVYDGEGKQKMEEFDMISFNNFYSLISSKRNSLASQDRKQIHHPETHPLSDYFVYADLTDYSNYKGKVSDKINNYELSLKKGCRCLKIAIFNGKEGQPMVKLDSETRTNFEEILKIIAQKAFQFNNYPVLLWVENNCNIIQSQIAANLIRNIFSENLYVLPSNYNEYQQLPCLKQLMKKIIIMSTGNFKWLKAKQKDYPEEHIAYSKIVTLHTTKVDFERKGQNCWNICSIEYERMVKFEEVEDENIANYAKKLILKSDPMNQKGAAENNNSTLLIRLGIQLLGVTFLNINEQNYIIQSKFLQNGGAKCGYLLKPQWMCVSNTKNMYAKNFQNPLYILSVKVISGQNCLINEFKSGNYWLQVFIRGNKKEQQVNKRFVSDKQNSGYYTKFALECEFTIYCPDISMIVFLIRGGESKTILSGIAVSIKHIRQGLRPLFLIGEHFKELFNSYLFVHVQRKELPKKINSFLEFSK